MKERRDAWKAGQPTLHAESFIFVDETWASTNLTRSHGRCPQGERLVMDVPHGHWKTTTFVVGLRTSGLIAPTVVDGPMTGDVFVAYVVQQLVPTLRTGDVGAAGILDEDMNVGTAPTPAPPLADDRTFAGRFRLRQPLGDGGMGEVWVADQTEPVQRRVALKVVRPGFDSARLLARFDQERQALALMDHPNIAKVLDAGIDEAGRPYFVMELIKGVPITEFCDTAKLSPRQRLELFVPVCQAVQHAHQKGVIHRDLKPSNILVALYDSKPVPKVIDFGVAKATGPRLTERSVYTEVGALIGTLEYMSPEQAELNNLDVDTRADVYALGVLLYELLTGTTPLDRTRVKDTPLLEVLRIIREDDTVRPSARLSTVAELAAVAARRGAEPRKLSGLVWGELDWIVMRALEKDRSRRYATASAFADDVECYLADKPVVASPPSTAYRLRKFLRRNRGPTLAAAAIVLLLLGGIVGTTLGLVRAEARAEGERRAKLEAEQAADAERDARVAAQQAEQEARESEADTKAFSDFLVNDVLVVPRPIGFAGGRGVDITMREALVAAQGRIDVTFRGRPQAEAVARHDLGVTFRLVGEHRLAEPHLRRAVALRQQTLGPEHPNTLASQNSLGALLTALGKHAEAIPLLDETLRRRQATMGLNDPLTVSILDNLGTAHRAAGHHERAIALHKEVLERRTAIHGPDHPQTLSTMGHLAHAYMTARQLALAIPLYQDILQRATAQLRPDDPLILSNTNNLAACYYLDNKAGLALPLFEKTFAIQKVALGPDHPDTINSMGNIASAHRATGHLERAVPLYEAALKLQRAKLDANHPDTLLAAYNLALAYDEQGKTDAAVPLFEEAAAGAERGGFTHEYAGRMIVSLFSCHERHGRYAQAEVWRRKWLVVVRDKMGPDSLSYSVELTLLGTNLLEQKKFADAEPVLRDCLRVRQTLHPGAWFAFNAQSMLGAALTGQQKHAEAEPLLLEAYRGLRRTEADIPAEVRDERLRSALERLIQLYDAWGKPAEAAKWCEKLAAIPESNKS